MRPVIIPAGIIKSTGDACDMTFLEGEDATKSLSMSGTKNNMSDIPKNAHNIIYNTASIAAPVFLII